MECCGGVGWGTSLGGWAPEPMWYRLHTSISKLCSLYVCVAGPRQAALNFKYTSDFDENGVLYYLGTQGRTADWRNPGAYSVVPCFFFLFFSQVIS